MRSGLSPASTRRANDPGARATVAARAVDLAHPADRGAVGAGPDRPAHRLLLGWVRGCGVGRDRLPRGRSDCLLLGRGARGGSRLSARRLSRRSRVRHGCDLGLRARVHLRVGGADDPGAALLSGPRGGASVRPARRASSARRAGPGARGNRVVAKRQLRSARVQARVHHGAVRAAARGGRNRGLAREQAGAGDGGRTRPRRRGRAASRPARPPSRPAGRGEPLRTRARLVARHRGGLQGVHP
jgi:hypothetical protein